MPQIGAHVRDGDPLAQAAQFDAELVQFFLADPQGWKAPKPREDAEAILASPVGVYIHAPYIVNVASSNNKIRVPSRKILLQHAEAAASLGAKGLIVHGGHVQKDDDPAGGVQNWVKTFERMPCPLPVLIENTAGGDAAMARRLDAIARLWDGVGSFDGVGLCLDTCHAHAAGEELVGLVDRVRAVTGRIDLVHCNDSKDPAGSGRDRHENLGHGTIDIDVLVAIVGSAGAPVICETAEAGRKDDIALLKDRLG